MKKKEVGGFLKEIANIFLIAHFLVRVSHDLRGILVYRAIVGVKQ